MTNRKQPSWLWGTLSLAAALILGLFDWWIGHELNAFVFYFFPVSLAAWFFGLTGAIGMSIICALIWFGADFMAGHVYASHGYAVWNTMIRLTAFLSMGWSVARLRDLLQRERATAKALRRSLSEIKVLEGILPICAQCKKIRDEKGNWQQLEVYIGQHSSTQFTHGYCPECYRKAMADAGFPVNP